MDIIAAHRQGLIEQLHEEVAALAGRGCDHGQRAVVLHHLYDHSGGRHVWALAEARQALRMGSAIVSLRRKLERWGWLTANRGQARLALEQLADALGEAAMARTALAYLSYRLSTTKALRNEAEERLPALLLGALDECHRARRSGCELSAEARQTLSEQSERQCAGTVDQPRLDAAWAAIDSTGLRRSAHRLLGVKALARATLRDSKRGWTKVERGLLSDPMLPASFRANPAQHFYALQQALAERRRQRWREACDLEPDAFELAA